MSAATLHAEIVAAMVAAGFTSSPTTLEAARIANTGRTTSSVSGHFTIKWPEGLPVESYTGDKRAMARPKVLIEVLYDLGTDPNAGTGAALTAGTTIASVLADLDVDGRWIAKGPEHTYLDDDRYLVVSVEADGMFEIDLT